jgi:hypothetical protein
LFKDIALYYYRNRQLGTTAAPRRRGRLSSIPQTPLSRHPNTEFHSFWLLLHKFLANYLNTQTILNKSQLHRSGCDLHLKPYEKFITNFEAELKIQITNTVSCQLTIALHWHVLSKCLPDSTSALMLLASTHRRQRVPI